MEKLEKIRVPQETEEKIRVIRQIENPYEAFVHFVQFTNGDYYKSEIGIPSKYNSESGSPIEWKWSPHKKIEQIDDNAFLYSGQVHFPAKTHTTNAGVMVIKKEIFHPKVLSFIEKNLVDKDPVYLEFDGKKYIISTDAISIGGGGNEHASYSGERVPGITIRPLNKQITLEGLVDLKNNL